MSDFEIIILYLFIGFTIFLYDLLFVSYNKLKRNPEKYELVLEHKATAILGVFIHLFICLIGWPLVVIFAMFFWNKDES